MTSLVLKANLKRNWERLEQDLVRDLKQEITHCTDPAQCGFVVQRHFDGLAFGVLGFVAFFLLVSMVGIAVFGLVG